VRPRSWRLGRCWSAARHRRLGRAGDTPRMVAGRRQSKTDAYGICHDVLVGDFSCAQNAARRGEGATPAVVVLRGSGSSRSKSVSSIDCIEVSYIIVDARS